jgi:hypothetical protein
LIHTLNAQRNEIAHGGRADKRAKQVAKVRQILLEIGSAKLELVIAKISQETLAEMIGTTKSRVSGFMKKFRKLGFIEYNGRLEIHHPLLSMVLHETPQILSGDHNAQSPRWLFHEISFLHQAACATGIIAWPASKLNYQCMKNHKTMMIGIGIPTIQRIKLRPMILLLFCFHSPGKTSGQDLRARRRPLNDAKLIRLEIPPPPPPQGWCRVSP